jgi:superfamily I DNA/RNA helicase
MPKYSPQQLECIKYAQGPNGNLVVVSCAGSGKTYTGVGIVHALPKDHHIVCTAFNTRITATLMEKMPPENTTCKGLNSLGHKSWGRRLKKFGRPNKWKSSDIRSKLGYDSDTFPDLPHIIGIAKAIGIIPKGAPGGKAGLTPDEPEVWESIIDDRAFDVGKCKEPVRICRETLLESIKMAWRAEIDFDDQIYMPALYDGEFDSCDAVLVDEVQDVSQIQRHMIHQMHPDRLFALGDPHQAIYGFRGADYTSVDHFRDEFNCRTLELSVSFRCPKEVVREAQSWVSHIEAHPDAPKGVVDVKTRWRPSDFEDGDVVLCRNNKPVVTLAFILLRAGVSCRVLGRDIGEGLMALIKKVAASEDLEETVLLLMEHKAVEKQRLEAKNKRALAAHLEDRVMSLVVIAKKLLREGKKETRSLTVEIDRMFAKYEMPVTLSTVHKAKGMEWRRVWLLDFDLIPSGFASTPPQIQQEHNLAYVAITRAMSELYYINTEDLEA